MAFPVDESPFGVFDLCGGAFEWIDAWFDEGRGLRFLKGGAWGQAVPERVSIPGGMGARPETTSGETGLRLIARSRGDR